MRLVDADALKEELAKNITIWTFNVSYDGILAEIIDNAPTVEITDYDTGYQDGLEDGLNDIRPQGEWIFQKANEEQTDGYECSNCKASFHTKVPYFSEFNFCPNCGAIMTGGGKK